MYFVTVLARPSMERCVVQGVFRSDREVEELLQIKHDSLQGLKTTSMDKKWGTRGMTGAPPKATVTKSAELPILWPGCQDPFEAGGCCPWSQP